MPNIINAIVGKRKRKNGTNWLQLGHEEKPIATKNIGDTHQSLSDVFFYGKLTWI
jgi:hypothetical protein